MSPEPARLSDLAARVADGAAVDWDRAAEAGDAEERRLVRHLRLVDSIAGLYRSIPDDAVVPDIDDATASISGESWGPLIILEQLGRGASCEVMRAFDKTLHREVALKLFHPGNAAVEKDGRGLAEARRLARIRHTNVVQVYGAEQHGGRAGIWMELIRGESLDAILAGRGPLGPREGAVIGQELCRALSAVHAAGLVHRDIKAQNVVKEPGGRVVLMDFGAGQELRHGVGSVSLAGTPLYLAPEIFAGKPATARSDIYSLGVLLFYLVTGEFPISAATIDELRRAHAAGERRRLMDRRNDLPAGFAATIERALATDPADRYANADEFGAALEEWTRVPSIAPAPPRPWLVHGKMLAAVVGVLAVAAVAGLLWYQSAAAPTPITAVAVLPVMDLSGGHAPENLADGLHVQLIEALGEVSTLQVPSRTSSLAVGRGERTIDEIASLLHVQAVVEPTVTVFEAVPGASPRLRLGIRLAAAGAEPVLLTERFEGPIGDALRLESEAALAIARRLGAVKPEEQTRRRTRFSGSVDQAALQALMDGRTALARYGSKGAQQSLDLFRRAFTIEPDLAPAYAGAARATITLGFNSAIAQETARAEAFQYATKALAIDPGLADGHVALADVLFYYDWDLQASAQHYQEALRINASSVDARRNYADLLAAAGRTAAGVEEAARLTVQDPQSPRSAVALGFALLYNREYQAASAAFERALALQGDSVGALIGQGRVAEAQRRYSDALRFTEDALRLSNGGGLPLQVQHACLLAKSGQVTAAREKLVAIERDAATRRQVVPAEYRAYVHLALGENDDAIGLLAEAVDARSPWILWMGADPRLEPVRNDPRFKRILARLNP